MRLVTLVSACPKRADTAVIGIPIESKLEACMCRSVCKLPAAIPAFRIPLILIGRYQVGFVISPVGLAENQIVVLIVSREQAAVFILCGSKELQGDDSGLRKTPGARPVVLRALHSQTGSRLFQALTYR